MERSTSLQATKNPHIALLALLKCSPTTPLFKGTNPKFPTWYGARPHTATASLGVSNSPNYSDRFYEFYVMLLGSWSSWKTSMFLQVPSLQPMSHKAGVSERRAATTTRRRGTAAPMRSRVALAWPGCFCQGKLCSSRLKCPASWTPPFWSIGIDPTGNMTTKPVLDAFVSIHFALPTFQTFSSTQSWWQLDSYLWIGVVLRSTPQPTRSNWTPTMMPHSRKHYGPLNKTA